MRWIVVAIFMAAAGGARAEALELLCQGVAVHTEQSHSFGSLETNTGLTANSDVTTLHKGRTEESFRVRVGADGSGQVKPPFTLLPVLSRGKTGWWDLEHLSITDDAISGSYSLNLLNHPSVHIDRHTGDIDVHGLGLRFTGSCEKAAADPASRKF
jgi:hypothetical protein